MCARCVCFYRARRPVVVPNCPVASFLGDLDLPKPQDVVAGERCAPRAWLASAISGWLGSLLPYPWEHLRLLQRKPEVPRATEVTAVGWRCPSRDSAVGKSYLLGNKI